MSTYNQQSDDGQFSTEQRSDQQDTSTRTLDAHYSAEQVYHALHCPYPGTDVLRTKQQQRAQASNQRLRSAGAESGTGATGAKDRRGERGVSL